MLTRWNVRLNRGIACKYFTIKDEGLEWGLAAAVAAATNDEGSPIFAQRGAFPLFLNLGPSVVGFFFPWTSRRAEDRAGIGGFGMTITLLENSPVPPSRAYMCV